MSEEGYRRRLSALLSADVEEYSRLMREDEDTTIRTVTEYRAAITDLVGRYRGRVVDSPGDNILAEFGSVVDAVNCAVEIQRDLAERNLGLAENRRMRWRIGVNSGDVVQDGDRIYGDGVNVAARMESLAEGGGICLSGTVYDSIVNKLGLEYEYLGEQAVKNIAQPIRAYRVLSYPGAAAHRVLKAKKAENKRWRHIGLAAAALVIMALVVVVWQVALHSPSIKPAVKPVQKMAKVKKRATTFAPKKALPLPDKPSIAVLPFVNLSGDPKQNYLGEGFSEQIIYALSKVPGICVIARHSSFSYKGKNVKVQQVGRELGVRYVLEGSVDRSGDRLQITAQLIDAQTGRHLWAERYDRKLQDIFALRDEITLKIVTAVGAKLTRGERVRVLAQGTTNVKAFLAVLKANELWIVATKAALHEAHQLAQRALALDPKYPAVHVLLGNIYFMEPYYDPAKPIQIYWSKAISAYQKALVIDGNYADAHAFLGQVYGLTGRWEKGLIHANRAIALNPGYAGAYFGKGLVLSYMGRQYEAIQEMKKSMRLNPRPQRYYYTYLGIAYFYDGQYQKAIATLKKHDLHGASGLWVHIYLALSYAFTNRSKMARDELAKALKINPKFSLTYFANLARYRNPRAAVKLQIEVLRKLGLK